MILTLDCNENSPERYYRQMHYFKLSCVTKPVRSLIAESGWAGPRTGTQSASLNEEKKRKRSDARATQESPTPGAGLGLRDLGLRDRVL